MVLAQPPDLDGWQVEFVLSLQDPLKWGAAVQLLEVAKNQLNKFYNPTNYKAPPAQVSIGDD